MANKPIDIVASQAKGEAYGRQAVWLAVRRLRVFTLAALRIETHPVSNNIVNEYVTCLVKAGYLSKSEAEIFEAATFTFIKDNGFHAPRLTTDGTPLPCTKQQLLWQCMKVLGTFTAQELADVATQPQQEVTRVHAIDYLMHLKRALYVVEVGKRKGGQPAVYRLVKNTGGKAPMVQRTKVLFDPNTNKAIALEEVK